MEGEDRVQIWITDPVGKTIERQQETRERRVRGSLEPDLGPDGGSDTVAAHANGHIPERVARLGETLAKVF